MRRSDTSITSTLESLELRKRAYDLAREALGPEDKCHMERNAEYGGEFVVAWGETNMKVGAARRSAWTKGGADCWLLGPGGAHSCAGQLAPC